MPLGVGYSVLSGKVFCNFFYLLFSGILQGLQICLFIVCSTAWDENSGLSLLAPIFRFFSFLGRGCPALGSPGPQGPLGMGALQPWPIRMALQPLQKRGAATLRTVACWSSAPSCDLASFVDFPSPFLRPVCQRGGGCFISTLHRVLMGQGGD